MPRLLIALVMLFFCHLMACNNKNQVTVSQKETTHKNKKKPPVALVATEDMCKSSAYENIKGNVPRLKAMLSGKFTVYNTNRDSARQSYSPWLVNEGKDSVVVYTIPVGEANRNGHWLYLYQYMTSLPDEPIYEAFAKLERIDRDSIVAIYYEAPEDFKYSMADILADPKGLFKEFYFDDLLLSETGEKVWYIRQSPLKYYGISNWIDTEEHPRPDLKNGFNRDYYIVAPSNYHFGKEYYTKEKKTVGKTRGARLIRQQMLSEAYNGR